MKVVLTDEALRDLDDILHFIASNYPTIAKAFEGRLNTVLERVGMWPHSAQEVADRPGVRAAPLIRYPYRVFIASRKTQLRSFTFTTAPAEGQRKKIIRKASDRFAAVRRPCLPAHSWAAQTP